MQTIIPKVVVYGGVKYTVKRSTVRPHGGKPIIDLFRSKVKVGELYYDYFIPQKWATKFGKRASPDFITAAVKEIETFNRTTARKSISVSF